MNKPLRFLFSSSDKFPPFRVDVDVLFADELASRGNKIDWILQSETRCQTAYATDWKNGVVYVSPNNNSRSLSGRLKKHVASILGDLKIFSLARKENYDFIQVKDKFIAALFALIAAKLNGTRFFYWLSYPIPEASLYAVKTRIARYPLLYWIRGVTFKILMYKIIMRYSDHVFVQSEQMKCDITNEGIPPEKMTPVPMGVKLEDFPGCLDKDEENTKTNDIVYLGTMLKVRHMDFMLHVFAKVLKEIPDARLFMVGDSEDEDDMSFLKKVASDLTLGDAVIFTGALPRNEALKYVTQASVGVSPFYPTPVLNSTSPTKLIEYMAMCRPVVANDHPDQSTVIMESKAGYCVAYDKALFSEAIVKLLKNKIEAREMGIRGRQYVENHRSYAVLSRQLEKKYYALCS